MAASHCGNAVLAVAVLWGSDQPGPRTALRSPRLLALPPSRIFTPHISSLPPSVVQASAVQRRTQPYESSPPSRISVLLFPVSASFAAPLGSLRCFDPCLFASYLAAVTNDPCCPLPACFASAALGHGQVSPSAGLGLCSSWFFASLCVLVCERRDLRLAFASPMAARRGFGLHSWTTADLLW